jgi:hypothetical protein
MKTVLLIVTCILAISLSAEAQRKVVLHHQGNATIFNSNNAFLDAYDASVDGDTIYLPGGQYGGLTLSKRLHIYGVGYHIDSTNATQYTYISGSISFSDGSDGSIIQGLYIGSGITVNYGHKVDNLVIRRNYIGSTVSFSGDFNASESSKSSNIEFYENIVGDVVSCEFSTNIHIHHNVFKRLMNIKENGWIHHNLWIESHYNAISNTFNSLFENNYIENGWWGFSNVTNNTFRNNAFNFNPTADLNNSWINSYSSILVNTLFVNTNTPYNFQQFNLSDLHLTDPLIYIGSDGTQIGLYGGPNPFKQGGIPENPHIQFKNIATQTDSNGDIQIEIKVASQNQ